jgi:NTP pyrophosphatase (non-canonical NTP hydrolase)
MFEIGSDKWPGISKLIEESGEVLQVCGKLMGAQGEIMHWDGTNLRERLMEELGDVIAAAQFVTAYCDLDPVFISERADAKLALFEQWHREQTRPPKAPVVPKTVQCSVCHGSGQAVAPISRYGAPSRCYQCGGRGYETTNAT